MATELTTTLPKRDARLSNEQQGLYEKYSVRRTDGSDAPGCRHHGCDHFVLDTMHDKHAAAALGAYANAVAATHPQLAADMRSRWGLAAPQVDPAVPAVAYRIDWPAEAGVGLPRFFGADDSVRMGNWTQSWRGGALVPVVRQSDDRAAIAARDVRIAELKADLRERDERIANMRTEWAAEVAALTERARSLDWNKEFEENVGRPPTDEDRKLMGVSE